MNEQDHPENWLIETKTRGNYIFTDGPIQESDIENLIELFADNWAAFVCPAFEGSPYLLDMWDQRGNDEMWRAEAFAHPERWRVDVYGVKEFADEYPITEEQ